MKKIALFIVFGLLFVNTYPNSREIEQDSVCYNLCSFFESKQIITNEYMSKFENDYCSLIMIWNILEQEDYPNLPDFDEFGIYKFDYIGFETSDASYVLIKNKCEYKIFLSADVSLIINELLRIKDEKNSLINDDLFEKYLKALTGFGKEVFSISAKTKNFEYIFR